MDKVSARPAICLLATLLLAMTVQPLAAGQGDRDRAGGLQGGAVG